MNPFDELCLKVGWNEYINVHMWNNDNFKQFIEDIKNNKNTNFEYVIEETINNKWKYSIEHNDIEVNVWDYGQLYTIKYVTVTENILKRLDDLAADVDNFVASLNVNV